MRYAPIMGWISELVSHKPLGWILEISELPNQAQDCQSHFQISASGPFRGLCRKGRWSTLAAWFRCQSCQHICLSCHYASEIFRRWQCQKVTASKLALHPLRIQRVSFISSQTSTFWLDPCDRRWDLAQLNGRACCPRRRSSCWPRLNQLSGEVSEVEDFPLKHLERSFKILKDREISWKVLNNLEKPWTILNDLERSWSILQHLETSWNILKHLEASWNILKLETSWNISKPPKPNSFST